MRRFFGISSQSSQRVNHQIRSREVRLIDVDGTQLGVRSLSDALQLAQNRGFDLVEVSQSVNPPVCKFVDFSKYRYEREKRLKEARKKQKAGQLKEIRLRPKISEHDLRIKLDHALEFLGERDKVRVTMVMRGRENEHKDFAESVLRKVLEYLEGKAFLEQDGRVSEDNRMSLLFAPKKK